MENELGNSAAAQARVPRRRMVLPRTARVPLTVLVAAGLVALLGFLYIKSQGVD
mgnify:FL=1